MGSCLGKRDKIWKENILYFQCLRSIFFQHWGVNIIHMKALTVKAGMLFWKADSLRFRSSCWHHVWVHYTSAMAWSSCSFCRDVLHLTFLILGEWISHKDQTQAFEHFKNLLVLGVANIDLCDSMRGDHLFSLVHLKEATAAILGWLYHFGKIAFLFS